MQTVLVVLGGLVVGALIGRLFAAPRRTRYARVQPLPVDDTLPPPGESARKSAEFVREFGALVERLAARDIQVHGMVCEPGTRWELAVGGSAADRDSNLQQDARASLNSSRKHRSGFQPGWETGKPQDLLWATRVSWRAGDEHLAVEKSPHAAGWIPRQWQEELAMPIGPEADALRAAEAFILERCATGA